MDLFLFFQICLLLMYLTSKLFLLRKNIAGWVVGGIAALLSVFFYLYIPNPDTGLAILEAGTTLFYVYGFIKWHKFPGVVEKTLFDRIFTAFAIIAGLTVITLEFIHKVEYMHYQLMVIAGFVIGGPMIARKKALGWIFYTIAHLAVSMWMYEKITDSLVEEKEVYYPIFSIYQAISATICLIAYFKYKKSPTK